MHGSGNGPTAEAEPPPTRLEPRDSSDQDREISFVPPTSGSSSASYRLTESYLHQPEDRIADKNSRLSDGFPGAPVTLASSVDLLTHLAIWTRPCGGHATFADQPSLPDHLHHPGRSVLPAPSALPSRRQPLLPRPPLAQMRP